MNIQIVKGNIANFEAEAIVNSADPSLLTGSGVCSAIHQAAGKKLGEACKAIGGCKPGKAVLTPGYDLKAKYVIHAVVPFAEKYGCLTLSDQETIVQCYKESIKLAAEYGIKTLAFPSLGSGVRGFPLKETAELAVKAVTECLNEFTNTFEKVYFVLYSDESFKMYQEVYKKYLHKPLIKISIKTDDATDFEGDAIIVPCDSELSYTKLFSPNPDYPLFKHDSKKSLIKNLFEKAGKELVRELTAVGFCEVGYAVITNGYELKVKNIIFMPITDHNNEESRINYVGLHQSLRAAFTLADLYKAKSVAIAGIRIPNHRKDFFKNLWNKFLGDSKETKSLSTDEIEDIIITTSKNLENNSIKDLFIYKYSK